MLIEALTTEAKQWEQPRVHQPNSGNNHVSISGGKQNVVLSHTEHDPAVARSEAGTHAATWVNAENPRPSEVRASLVYA